MTDVTARAVAVRCRLGGIPRAPTCSLASRIAPLRVEAILIRVGRRGRLTTVRH